MKARLFLFLWFYVGWFGCVFLAQQNFSVETLIFPLISWVVLIKTEQTSLKTVYLLLSLSAVGLIFDAISASLGWIQFALTPQALLPIWLVSIWLQFVSVLPLTRVFFQSRLWLAAIFGFIFGPLSYRAGEVFGLMHFSHFKFVIIYAVFWGLFFPAAIFFQRKIS